MNNKEKYKKAIDQIHAPDDLKKKTLEKMTKTKNRFIPLKIISVAAVFLIVFTLGFETMKRRIDINANNNPEIATMKDINSELPRFKDMDEYKSAIKNASYSGGIKSNSLDTRGDIFFAEAADSAKTETRAEINMAQSSSKEEKDYSLTNNQVKDVDEADIVKTDGEYIYYVANGIVNIVDAEKLELMSEIREDAEKNETFRPRNVFINGKKLVVIGNYSKSNTETDSSIRTIYSVKAKVYDLEDIKEPKVLREVSLEGNYQEARMIGDNVYFVSRKGISYYEDDIKNEDVLPMISDSISEVKEKRIDCTDIAYFPESSSYSLMIIGGFNINNNESVNIETILGASDTIYCSEKNMYLTQTIYSDGYISNRLNIYKFELNNSKVTLNAKGEVRGYLNNQFSMDEYEGNLRIATTVQKRSIISEVFFDRELFEDERTANIVYVLNEKLEEIGRLDNIAEGERIYAVRFIGKIGYVVTFEEIDPLFVIDLSNPTNPEMKGELEIPGYSSYLHPFDDNHIIGIGYNTESNGYGGVRNTNLKMSMFDVSDLNNPKEMFNISIGGDYAYSDIVDNHKSLFYKSADNLIGFPYRSYSYDEYGRNNWNFEIFHIDLEKGFEKYCKFSNKYDYIERMIYIEDTIYELTDDAIISYNLKTGELLKELELNDVDYYEDYKVLY